MNGVAIKIFTGSTSTEPVNSIQITVYLITNTATTIKMYVVAKNSP